MPMTPLPPPPTRQDPEATFVSKANAFLGALPTFVTEANALADDVSDDAAAAAASAAVAEAAQVAAVGAANYRGDYSQSTTYQVGQSVSSGGSIWIAKTVNVGVSPVEGVNWTLLRPAVATVPAGGTGRDTLTAKSLLVGNGTGQVSFIAPGSANQVLISNGTDWVAGAAPGLASLGMFSAAAAAATPVALPNLYFAGVQSVYPSSSSVNGPSILWCQSLGVFACTAGSSRVLTSPDGVTWTVRTNTITGISIAFDGTNLVTSTGSSVSRSTDGVTFANVTALPGIGNDSAGVTGRILWAGNAGDSYLTTNGGTSYSTETMPAVAESQPTGKSIFAVGSRFVFKNGNNLYHSTTGTTGSWTTLAIADVLTASVIVGQGPDGCLYIATGTNATGRLLRFIRLNVDMTFTTIANLVGQTYSINSTTRAAAVRLGSSTFISANGQTSINGAGGRYHVGDLPSFSDTGTSQAPGFFALFTQWAQSSTRIVSTSNNITAGASNYAISYPINGPTGLYQV